MRKENISAGNSFLSVWGHKQTEAQEERKETKKRKEDRKNVQTQERKSRCPSAGEQGNGGGWWSPVQHVDLYWQPAWGFFLFLLKIFHKPRRQR